MTVKDIIEKVKRAKALGLERKEALEYNKKKVIKEATEFFKVLDYIKKEGFNIARSYVIGSGSNQNINLRVLLDADSNIVGIGFVYDDRHRYTFSTGFDNDTSYAAYLDREGKIHIKPRNPKYKPDIDFEKLLLDEFDILRKEIEERLVSDINYKYAIIDN